MSRHRARLTITREPPDILRGIPWPPPPKGATVVGYVARGDGDQGRLIRLASAVHVMQTAGGGIQTVEQRKVTAALAQK